MSSWLPAEDRDLVVIAIVLIVAVTIVSLACIFSGLASEMLASGAI